MRIAVMAAGAVGGYFGARLAAAGHDVTFIARGAHLDAIRMHGLRVESPLGNLHIQNANATSVAGEVGAVDIVLFAVKLWDTEVAAAAARPLVAASSRIITLQNGVDSVERLQPILGEAQVVGGTTHMASVMSAPGMIVHTSQFAQLRLRPCGSARRSCARRLRGKRARRRHRRQPVGRHQSRPLEEVHVSGRTFGRNRHHAAAARAHSG